MTWPCCCAGCTQLPEPAFDLPDWAPLDDVARRIADAEELAEDDREFLADRRAALAEQLAALEYPLPSAVVHGDAHLGNLIPGPDGPVLCDFDSTSEGPPEWDLTPVLVAQRRFGGSIRESRTLLRAYGFDVTKWPGFEVLRAGARAEAGRRACCRSCAATPMSPRNCTAGWPASDRATRAPGGRGTGRVRGSWSYVASVDPVSRSAWSASAATTSAAPVQRPSRWPAPEPWWTPPWTSGSPSSTSPTSTARPAAAARNCWASALAGRRDRAVIATKFGMDMQGANGPDFGARGSRRYVRRAVESSLRRLGTDWIDLYQLHRPDPRTPLEETLSALDDLVHEGKIRYVGHCNLAGWQVADAAWTARDHGTWPRRSSAQNHYSLLEREAEREIVPACAHGSGRAAAVLPAGQRPAHRQVPAGRRAAGRQPAGRPGTAAGRGAVGPDREAARLRRGAGAAPWSRLAHRLAGRAAGGRLGDRRRDDPEQVRNRRPRRRVPAHPRPTCDQLDEICPPGSSLSVRLVTPGRSAGTAPAADAGSACGRAPCLTWNFFGSSGLFVGWLAGGGPAAVGDAAAVAARAPPTDTTSDRSSRLASPNGDLWTTRRSSPVGLRAWAGRPPGRWPPGAPGCSPSTCPGRRERRGRRRRDLRGGRRDRPGAGRRPRWTPRRRRGAAAHHGQLRRASAPPAGSLCKKGPHDLDTLPQGHRGQPDRHVQRAAAGRRRDRQDRPDRPTTSGASIINTASDRRVRRPDRPGRVLLVQGRRRRPDPAGRPRAGPVRHPRDDHRPRHHGHPDAGRRLRRVPRGLAAGVPFPKRLGPPTSTPSWRWPSSSTTTSTARSSAWTARCAWPPARRRALRSVATTRPDEGSSAIAGEDIHSRRACVACTSSSLYSSRRCRWETSAGAPSMPTASRYQRIEFSPPASGSRQWKPATGAMIFRPLPLAHRNWSRHDAEHVDPGVGADERAAPRPRSGTPGLPAKRSAETQQPAVLGQLVVAVGAEACRPWTRALERTTSATCQNSPNERASSWSGSGSQVTNAR